MFPIDQVELGFEVRGADGGQGTVDFYRRDGSLLHTYMISALADTNYAFRSDSGVAEIAGITLTNFNGGGVVFDNFRYVIPEPGSLIVWSVLAVLAMTVCRWRRKRAA